MINIKKAGLQSVVAVTLLMGNIDAPSMDAFYEDDASFNEVASALTSGWGWGISSAHARNDRNCTSMDECFDIVGSRPDSYEERWLNERNNPDSRDTINYDDYDGRHDGGGGGGNREQYIKQCNERVSAAVENCKDTYMGYTTTAGILCGRISWGIGAATCGGGATSLVYKAHKWCDAQGTKMKERECN
ncbi:hypothetical protein [Pseudoalteromonas byunsanensis]|uniref:hypothetical protein n=1 Tax=Pseudoalteromonas byunsanensis TaxID=327939 RepID=UPI0011133D31|nr:hypothetical protein [Pseudoalteromonas byunsanensis]